MAPAAHPGSDRQPRAWIRMQARVKTIPKSRRFLAFCGQLCGVNECVRVCVCVHCHESPVQAPLTLDVSWTLSCRTVHLFPHSPQTRIHTDNLLLFLPILFLIFFSIVVDHRMLKTVPVLLIRALLLTHSKCSRFHPPAPDPESSPLLLSSLSATQICSLCLWVRYLPSEENCQIEVNLCYLKWRVGKKELMLP